MKKETWEETGERLNESVRNVTREGLAAFLERERASLLTTERPFADYMRLKFREKGVLRQNVFLAADLSENYGYKLLAEEKHTRQRDVILRLCLAAGFRLEEVREALILYGMAPLHARFPRDAALTVAVQDGLRDLREVNRLLESCGLPPLVRDYE